MSSERSVPGDATQAAAHSLEGQLRLLEYIYQREPDGDFGYLLEQVLARLVKACRADRGFLFLREPDGSLTAAGGYDAAGEPVESVLAQASSALAAQALTASCPLELADAPSESSQALEIQVAIGAPLRARNHPVGCVVLDRRGRAAKKRFATSALELLQRFAQVAPGLLVRARQGDAQRARQAARQRLFQDAPPAEGFDRGAFVGQSEPVTRMFRFLERLAPLERFDVLIQGETGAGKELVACALHTNSPRSKGPFVAVNCAAFPSQELLMSALFGHAKGAFTGAVADQPGYFESAAGGTLFLDEIGEAKAALQAALLRALQEREVIRVGETQPRKVDVRVVSASHRDLTAMEAEGRFRRDLLYRLNMATVHVPPLSARVSDVPLLARAFAADEAKKLGDPAAANSVDDAFVRRLQRRAWPGNVRELENAVRMRVAVGAEFELPAGAPLPVLDAAGPLLPLKEHLARAEGEHVRHAVAQAASQKEAAETLGVSVRTLQRLLDKHGLTWKA